MNTTDRLHSPGEPAWERFEIRPGRVHLTGLQALARLPLDQVRRDRAAGRRVGGLISGYPGSPLAGFDSVLRRIEPLLAGCDLRFQPGVNEELAAAAVAGSQLVDLFPHPEFDGAIGLWFGKAPGLDRSLDVLRHANFTGISRFGGAVAAVGDDPACKSSSLPSQSELALAHAMIPVLAPGGAGEVLELGLHAYTLSRYAGVWAALKLVADVCDGGELIDLPEAGRIATLDFATEGASYEKRLDPRLLPPAVVEIERDLVFARLEAARHYAYVNGLDQVEHRGEGDRIGFAASGTHYRALLAAFELLGIGDVEKDTLGLRILRLALVYPVETRRLREFARGLQTIVVLDDRRGFLEQQIRAGLYDLAERPEIAGQSDRDGAPWLPRAGALTSESLALDLGAFLAERCNAPHLAARVRELSARAARAQGPLELARRPHFCSGCPHLSSTRVPDGLAAAGGIGCHTMVLLSGGEMRFVGAMGSEGAAWIGLAPFVETPHLFQNLGDGTYFHSGRQAIRACVEARVPITFKLLYNGAVAMTGGQRAEGEKPVAQVVRDLLADGVSRVVAMSDDLEIAALARSGAPVEVISRDRLDAAMRALSTESGVTVLLYDELCANTRQRGQRRGTLPGPAERIWINQDVCEGCGDCGGKSECLSVHPVSTTLGRKTRIHQGSCAQDEVCIRGDCPAFVSLPADLSLTPLEAPPEIAKLVENPAPDPPLPTFDDDWSILMVGIGSTGVVTVSAILMAAAQRDGRGAQQLDQTGLSQRGGRVVSHCRIMREPRDLCGRIPAESADLLLAFDPLAAAEPGGLPQISRDRTHTVVHESLTPTADMVRDPAARLPDIGELSESLARRSRAVHAVPAEPLSTAVLGSHLAANVLVLGFAFERGLVPLRSTSIESAITELGVASATNVSAFRLGRALAAHPEHVEPLLAGAVARSIADDGSPEGATSLLGSAFAELASLVERGAARDTDGDLCARLAAFATDLCAYQNRSYALRYVETLLPVARAEVARGEHGLPLTAIAGRELYRLMAYKDEYEVARLHLTAPFRRWLDRRTGGRTRPVYWLHPPLLRALGFRKKLRGGRWLEAILWSLAGLRRLRGTPFDPFGYTTVRREERDLVAWYADLLARLASRLEATGVEAACAVAREAEGIRGYEELKLRRAAIARERVSKALAEL